ncbi:MAG: AmpG family muropeptide MFS transporter [Halobacteriovoraceae bacterium]|nr:AmpG family muropeptide MFS transporter [Halobacteriovoraceae bacterium]
MTKNHSFIDLMKALASKRMLIVLFLGFSSGLPIMLLYSTIKIWMRREGVDLSTVGYFSWITLPYTFNFVWSFLLDRYVLFNLGRRKSWLILTQFGLIASLLLLSLGNPTESISYLAFMAFILCFFSATQDIAVDAYRREILPDDELGIGASIGVYGYRIGMLMASGFGLWIVDTETFGFSFNQMFQLMAALMLIGVVTTLIADEPNVEGDRPDSFIHAIINPFKEFFVREYSIWILLFIIFYKMGDSVAGAMTGPFYVDMGFSNKDIAEITKGVGFISSMAGLFVGGWTIYKIGILRSLWFFGFLQAISTSLFSILTFSKTLGMLALVVSFEDFSSGMGTAAQVAFMASLTNKRFTATQYALFASLASFGRTFVAGWSGHLVVYSGYFSFFIIGSILAIPGMLLLLKVKRVSTDF